MNDNGYTISHRDDFETTGNWSLARRSLGVNAFGINLVTIPAGESIPEHTEAESDQEELFIVLSGTPTMVVNGQEIPASTGTFCRVDPSPTRTVVNNGPTPAEILIVSAPRTSGYKPMSWA